MASFRLGQAAELLGLSSDAVRRLADSGRLPTTRSTGGQRLIDGVALAEFARAEAADAAAGQPDVVANRSARNRFPGIITRVIRDGVMAQVEIQAGPHRVVSLISAEAVDELGLEPGVAAIASVKSTNVVVELPAP